MIKILTILLAIPTVFSSNETPTFKVKPTEDCGTFLNWMTVESRNPELASLSMGQLTIHSPKHGSHLVLYDSRDHKLISKYHWYLSYSTRSLIYASTWIVDKKGKGHNVKMHRMLMGFPLSKIDHRNGNCLDNRRSNLRLATNGQNAQNGRVPKNNTSGYKGVNWHKRIKKYQAYITLNWKRTHLGYFNKKKDAAIAYNQAALKYHGEFANLNQL